MTRGRAADNDVEWQTTHNRRSTMKEAAAALACGGGKEQMAQTSDAPPEPRVALTRGGPRMKV